MKTAAISLFALIVIHLTASSSYAVNTCQLLFANIPGSVENGELWMSEREYFSLSQKQVEYIATHRIAVTAYVEVGNTRKQSLLSGRATTVEIEPKLPADVRSWVETLERVARSRNPLAFPSEGYPIEAFRSLAAPHPLEPWTNYPAQFEVGLWLARLSNGDLVGQFYTSRSRTTIDEQASMGAWMNLTGRTVPSEIVEVMNFHTHPMLENSAPNFVFASRPDEIVAHRFIDHELGTGEIPRSVQVFFAAVSRVGRKMYLSTTNLNR